MKNSSNSDPFLLNYNASELQIASEFLSTWLPFLSRDLCTRCTRTLSDRVRSLHQENQTVSMQNNTEAISCTDKDCDTNSLGSWKDGANDTADTNSIGSCKDDGWSEAWKDGTNGWSEASTSNTTTSTTVGFATPVQKVRMSWADMAQEDELEAEEESAATAEEKVKVVTKTELTREQREYIRFSSVGRKKDFICLERVGGKIVNILDGLELHTGVFSAVEQKRIIEYVYSLEEKGKNGELKDRTYTAPVKWMRGKGRVTIQFGCCYNYSHDKNGNPPGILQTELVDPIPHLFKVIIRRLVRWHVLPPTCVPDSCIVNIYDEGDCIPPHIDNHDFVRPFCTVSFLSECNIVFGSTLKIVAAGEFSGAIAIPLPLGSVLVLNGNGADVAKHCVPAVPTKRISITFRKMDESKWPKGFVPEPDLQGLEPLTFKTDNSNRSTQSKSKQQTSRQSTRRDENRQNINGDRSRRSAEPRISDENRQNKNGDRSRRSVEPRISDENRLNNNGDMSRGSVEPLISDENRQNNYGDRSRGSVEPRISDENRQNNNGDRSRGSTEPRISVRTRLGPTNRRQRVDIDY